MPNLKITQLTEETTASNDEVLPIVFSPLTAPVTKKIQKNNLLIKSAVYTVAPTGIGGADYYTDGTADEVQINAAITAIGSGGGKVLLREGSYYLAAPISITNSNITLEGEGYGTIINLSNSANCDMIRVTGTGVKLVQIGNFKMNGNKTNNSSGNGIYNDTPPDFNNTDSMHTYHDMYIIDCKNDGIQTKFDLVNFARVIKFETIRIEGSGDNAWNVLASDCMYIDCEALTSGKNGFFSRGGAVMMVNCKAFVNAQTGGSSYAGFYFDGGGNQIVGCQAQDNKYNGFYLSQYTYNTVLSGCVSDGNGTSGTGNGLQITDSARASVVGGSYSNHADMANLQQRGIYLTGTTTKVQVVGVVMDANLVGGFVDSSSGSNQFLGYNPDVGALDFNGGYGSINFKNFYQFITYGDTQLAQSADKLGFFGTAPISRAVLATGTGKTVDNVITALQNLGLVKQS